VKLLTVSDVADRLSISQSLCYRLVAEGKLRAFRIGKGALRFREEDLAEYMESCVIEVRLEPRKAPTASGKPFIHLDGDRLLAEWRRRGVRIDRQDGRNTQTSE